MTKKKGLRIPDCPRTSPPPLENDNPFDALKEGGEIKLMQKGANEPVSYEYDVVSVQLGWDLKELVKILSDTLRIRAAQGWRYKNAIRKNVSEEVLIFERGVY